MTLQDFKFRDLPTGKKVLVILGGGTFVLIALTLLTVMALAVAWSMAMVVAAILAFFLCLYAVFNARLRNKLLIPVDILVGKGMALYARWDPQGAIDAHLASRQRNLATMNENLQLVRENISRLEATIAGLECEHERTLVVLKDAEERDDDITLAREGLAYEARDKLLEEQRAQLHTFVEMEAQIQDELKHEQLEIDTLRQQAELARVRLQTSEAAASALDGMNPVDRVVDNRLAKLALEHMHTRTRRNMSAVGVHALSSNTSSGDPGSKAWGKHVARRVLAQSRAQEAGTEEHEPKPMDTLNSPPTPTEEVLRNGGNERSVRERARQAAIAQQRNGGKKTI